MSEEARKPDFFTRDNNGEWIPVGKNINFEPVATAWQKTFDNLCKILGKYAEITTTKWAATIANFREVAKTIEQISRLSFDALETPQARRRLAKRLNRKRRMDKTKKTWRTQARLFQRYGAGITVYYRILRDEERRKKTEHPRTETAQTAPTDCVGLVKGFFWGANLEKQEADE